MQQRTCAEVRCEQYCTSTRRERFLEEMNGVVPWADVVALIEPIYLKAKSPGCPPGRRRTHAASAAWSATVVQSVGSGRGGGAVQVARQAAVRRH